MTRTYGKLELGKDQDGYTAWLVEVEPHVAIRLRRLFRRVEDTYRDVKLRHTDEVAKDLLWFTQRYPLEMPAEAREFLVAQAEAYDRRFEEFESVFTGVIAPRPFEMAIPPRAYQAVAAELALRTRQLLIADDLGLGKSCSAIAMLTDPKTRPALVVTMTNLPIQWEREVLKFIPGMSTHVIKKRDPYDITAKRPRDRRDVGQMSLPIETFPDVIITSYSKLANWAEFLAPYIKTLIFDEIQELRRNESKKYNAAEVLARASTWRVGLSATPIYNVGAEMYNVMEILAPDALGAWHEFAAEWCGYKNADRVRATVVKPKAFGAYLREQGLMIRRTRKEVGRELPPMNKVPHYVDSDKHVIEAIEGDLSQLAQRMLDKSVLSHDRMKAAGEIDWKLRRATGVAKAPYVAEFTKMLLETGVPKILLFGWHRDVYDIWLNKLDAWNPMLYTGTESPTQKQKSFDAFNDPESLCSVMMMSLRSGAGLDGLQYGVCTTVIFGELDWSPAIHDQCSARLHRDGQDDNVTAYYLVSDEGSDPYVSEVLGLKRAQIQGVQDPNADIVEKFDRGTGHIKKIAEEYLRRSKLSRLRERAARTAQHRVP